MSLVIIDMFYITGALTKCFFRLINIWSLRASEGQWRLRENHKPKHPHLSNIYLFCYIYSYEAKKI